MAGGAQPVLRATDTDSKTAADQVLTLSGHEALLRQMFVESGGEQFKLSFDAFHQILTDIVRRYLPSDCSHSQIAELLASLHVNELVLARACAAGNEPAWEEFLTHYREPLFETAASLTRDDVRGHELADSLYAELYGDDSREGKRVSKLESYTGIGSLGGWLRTVLVQSFIDLHRRERRLVSLDQEEDDDQQQPSKLALDNLQAPVVEQAQPPDPRLESSLEASISALSSEERFILKSYFLDGATLAQLSRTLGVHESTMSRRIDKILASIRKSIRRELLYKGMSRAAIDEALEADVRLFRTDLRRQLENISQDKQVASFNKQKLTAAEVDRKSERGGES